MNSNQQFNRGVSNTQRAVLEEILKQKVARPKMRPLSFAQERLWFLYRIEPNNPYYNVTEALRLQGKLDYMALEQSINALVERHETFRTSIVEIEGEPKQVIVSDATLTISVDDLSHWSLEEGLAKVREMVRSESLIPFDLTRGPLFRVRLFQLTATDHVLLFVFHHIIADGWSFAILHRELETLYSGYIQKVSPTLPPLRIQFSDYAVWQREHLQGEKLADTLAYWLSHLKGAPPTLDLHYDFPRPAKPTYRGAEYPFVLSAESTMKLRTLCRQEDATLFMGLVALFVTLLARYSNQDDIVIGTPIANRTREEIEGLIGFFANTLPLRINLAGDPSLRQVIERTRTTCLGGYAHQDVPFEKIVEAIQPERNFSRSPLFQVSISLGNMPQTPFELPEVQASSFDFENPTAKFDLSLDVREAQDGSLHGVFEYPVDLFSAENIEWMCLHLQVLIETAPTCLDESVWKLPVLSERDRRTILSASGKELASLPSQNCCQCIERQAALTPEAIAVIYQDQYLSYQALNERANQLAHYLQMLGVGPESWVGILLDRSPDFIIAVLAVLKAGGAFLPIDPFGYQQSNTFGMSEVPVSVLVSCDSFHDRLPTSSSRKDIYLDQEQERFKNLPSTNPETVVSPDNTAYISCVPGTACLHEGVLITYGNLAHAIRDDPLRSGMPVLLLALPCTFNSSIYGLLDTLAQGGTVCLPNDPDAPGELADSITRLSVSHLMCLLATYKALLVDDPGNIPHTLSTVVMVGEVYPSNLIEMHEQTVPNVQLIMAYGATECSGWITSCSYSANHPLSRTIPISQSTSGTQAYVLDTYLRLSPVGIPGELCLGGWGVARGYSGQSSKTATRFIPDGFSGVSGMRLFRTGEMVRYLPDGGIEFLGNREDTHTVYGFRSRPFEIETILRHMVEIKDAAITIQGHGTEDNHLIAYVVPLRANTVIDQSHLDSMLRQQLPEYKHPVAFIKQSQLPLTPAGRLNRNALLLTARSEHFDQISNEESMSDFVVQSLIEIWKKILHVEKVDSSSNFFDLGGHSLLAIRMNYRIREVFDIDVPLYAFFEQPTIKQLARVIENLLTLQSEDSQV